MEVSTIAKDELFINEQIRDKEVRLIDAEGNQQGVVSLDVAMRMADEAGLDLVKIAPNAVPPVCKVMDYGKYKFEQGKREKEQRKNQKVIELKEIRLSATIDVHDMEVKAKTPSSSSPMAIRSRYPSASGAGRPSTEISGWM